jgi:PHD/YefM family antitoxin component YafN of YafNO toxin-antitoxin module
MAFAIEYGPDAEDHLRALTASQRATVLDAVDRQLTHSPHIETRNRKRMRPNGNQGTGKSQDWGKGGRTMTVVETKEAKESVAKYATQSRGSPVVFTRKGKPVAALMDLHNVDWETLSLSLNPEFIGMIEESRRRHRQEGGISGKEMRRRLAAGLVASGRVAR